jgi:hypothetical protein
MTYPTLLYESENWVTKNVNIIKIQRAEVEFLRNMKLCETLDKIKKDVIRNGLSAYAAGKRKIRRLHKAAVSHRHKIDSVVRSGPCMIFRGLKHLGL